MKKSKINKKGFSMISESDKMLFWGLVVLVIIACTLLIVAWTGTLKGIYLNDALEPTAYESRLIYSDNCFAYKDDNTGRVYTGTIDPDKFNEQNLFKCLPLDGLSTHAISVTLEIKDAENKDYGKTIKSANWDMKTDKITMRTYVVQVQGYGPGLITFYHKSGN